MLGINSLAVELLQEIIKHVANPDFNHHGEFESPLDSGKLDLYSLRSTCKLFNLIVGPIIFSHIILDVSKTRLGNARSQLESLATATGTPTGTSLFIRSLEIRRLDPVFDRARSSISYTADEIRQRSTDTEGPDGEIRLIKELLGPAIASLQNLNRVSWNWNPVDPVCAESVVINSLLELSSLEELVLRISESHRFSDATVQVFRAFRKFTGLRKISIMGGTRELWTCLGGAIGNCPHLSSLEAGSFMSFYSEATPALYDLLGGVPKSRPLHLQHLALTEVHLNLGETILLHLKSLTSLKIRKCYTPESESSLAVAGIDFIWKSLRTEGIRLTSLDTDAAMNAHLIDYIASYSGLERLVLEMTNRSDAPQLGLSDARALAAKFFQVSLPRHAETLVHMSISPRFEGSWSLSEDNASAILRCKKLEYLSLRLDLNDIPLPRRGTREPIDPQFFERVDELLQFSKKLPCLRELAVSPTYERSASLHNSRHAVRRHLQCRALGTAIIGTPISPIDDHIDPSTGSPKMRIGLQAYTVQWNDKTSDYRYCSCGEIRASIAAELPRARVNI